jgi:hypothetical protein
MPPPVWTAPTEGPSSRPPAGFQHGGRGHRRGVRDLESGASLPPHEVRTVRTVASRCAFAWRHFNETNTLLQLVRSLAQPSPAASTQDRPDRGRQQCPASCDNPSKPSWIARATRGDVRVFRLNAVRVPERGMSDGCRAVPSGQAKAHASVAANRLMFLTRAGRAYKSHSWRARAVASAPTFAIQPPGPLGAEEAPIRVPWTARQHC